MSTRVFQDQGIYLINLWVLCRKGPEIIAPLLRRAILQRHNLYVSLRQSSEWGMRALQGTFSRLKSRLPSNKSKRKYIIGSIVFLHNFRTEYVGLNQIVLYYCI